MPNFSIRALALIAVLGLGATACLPLPPEFESQLPLFVDVATNDAPPAPPLMIPESEALPNETVPVSTADAGSIVDETIASRGERVLATIPFSPSAVDFTISFYPHRQGFQGLTFTERRHIEIYVDHEQSDASLRYVIAHELGHAIDIARMSLADRSAWRLARGIAPSTLWWASDYATDLATPAGDFAECVAAYLIGSTSHSQFGGCVGTTELISQVAQP